MNTVPHPAAVTRWTIDPGHSAVGFSVRHMMITNVRGEFERFRGEVDYDPSRPEATRIDTAVDVSSINTRETKRDGDLRGPLFFDVAVHPEMTFRSKSARPAGDDGLDVIGDLTIRGVTREVTLAVRDITAPRLDLRGKLRVGATATTKIERAAFGITWNKTLDAGGVVVGEIVTVTLEVSLLASG